VPFQLNYASGGLALKALVKKALQPLRRWPVIFYGVRLLRPGQNIYQHLYFTGIIKVNVSDKASFRAHHFGAKLENELFWAGYGRGWEGYTLRLWRELCLRSRFIADIGANTGIYALAAAALNTNAEIIAIEPVPRIYNKLTSNIAINNFDIKAYQVAASDHDGESILFDTGQDHSYSASLEEIMSIEGGYTSEVVRTTVSTVRLDSLFDEIKVERIDLLKIDVENHELKVLTGMRNRLDRDKPTLVIEIFDFAREAVAKLLTGLNYKFFVIDESNGLIPIVDLTYPVPGGSWNFLICQDNIAQALPLDLHYKTVCIHYSDVTDTKTR
jgi:FkbM family methyltransferase